MKGFHANRPVPAKDLFAYAEQVRRSSQWVFDLEGYELPQGQSFQFTYVQNNERGPRERPQQYVDRVERLRRHIEQHGLPPIQIVLPDPIQNGLYINGIPASQFDLQRNPSCPQ